jgi:hypothetical protein
MERGERRIDLVEFLIIIRAIGADANKLIRVLADKLPSDATL